MNGYVHGYTEKEASRLVDQATTLTELLHSDTAYPAGSLVLEAGCGVGAQTITLAAGSPQAEFISVDISQESLAQARQRVHAEGFRNVTFQRADMFNLPFAADHFDHVFVCFVLEHLSEPAEALIHVQRVLKPGGSITVIEGDHGSAYFHPDSIHAVQGNPVPHRSASSRGRRFPYRPSPVPAARSGRFSRCTGLSTDGLRGWEQACSH